MIKDDIQILFGTEEGKRVLVWLCRECNVLQTSYMPGGRNEDMLFKEGMRNAASLILSNLEDTTDIFSELQKGV